jgi:hypothetical protein
MTTVYTMTDLVIFLNSKFDKQLIKKRIIKNTNKMM